jgi:hypothetical protein
MSPFKGMAQFVADDPAGLWKQGDLAIDQGWETPDDPTGVRQRLLVLRRTGETLSLHDPYVRGTIRPVQPVYIEDGDDE